MISLDLGVPSIVILPLLEIEGSAVARQKECGIYKITSPSGKCYIGSSAHMRKRFNEHRGHFQRGDHYNGKLRNAARKYGVDAMRLEIVLVCDRDVLRDLEQLAINHVKPEYNIEQTVAKVLHDFWKDPVWRERNAARAGAQLKERWRDPEQRARMTERTAAINTPERRHAARERLLARWKEPDFLEAARRRGSERFTAMFQCPDYRKKHSAMRSAHMKEQCKDDEFRRLRDEAAAKRNRRPVYCITLDRYFPSVGDAARDLGVSLALLSKQFRGLHTRTGWQWRYLTDDELAARGHDPQKVRKDMPRPDRKKQSRTKQFKPVICDEIGLAFPSADAAQRAFGLELSGTIACAISSGKRALGYKWRYVSSDEADKWPTVTEFGAIAHLRIESRGKMIRCVETGQVFQTMKLAAVGSGFPESSHYAISDYFRGRKESALGFHWERVEVVSG